MYFGWADALLSPQAGVDYYERVLARMGGVERTQRSSGCSWCPAWGTVRAELSRTRSARRTCRRGCGTIQNTISAVRWRRGWSRGRSPGAARRGRAGAASVQDGGAMNSAEAYAVPARRLSAHYPWILIGLLWMVAFLNAADRSILVAVMPQAARGVRADAEQLALINSVFFWIYAFAAFLFGRLGDSTRRSWVIVGGLAFWSVATGLVSLATGFSMLLALRWLVALGEATYYPTATALISDWHRPTMRSRALSIHQTAVLAGTGFGALRGRPDRRPPRLAGALRHLRRGRYRLVRGSAQDAARRAGTRSARRRVQCESSLLGPLRVVVRGRQHLCYARLLPRRPAHRRAWRSGRPRMFTMRSGSTWPLRALWRSDDQHRGLSWPCRSADCSPMRSPRALHYRPLLHAGDRTRTGWHPAAAADRAALAMTIGMVLLASSSGKGIVRRLHLRDDARRRPARSAGQRGRTDDDVGVHRRRAHAAVRRQGSEGLRHGGRHHLACARCISSPWSSCLPSRRYHASGRHRDARARGGRSSHERVAACRSGAERTSRARRSCRSSMPPLAPDQVRIRTLFSGVSAGHRAVPISRHEPLHASALRRDLAPVRATRMRRAGPIQCATSAMRKSGEIVEVGSAVRDLHPANVCSGPGDIARIMSRRRDYARERLLPADADPRIGIFSHIGAVALNGVHDAAIRMGDLVVVFGLGVPGQIVAQAARAAGATVIGVDPVRERREDGARSGRRPRAGSCRRIRRRSHQGRNRRSRRRRLHRSVGCARCARRSDSRRRVCEPRRGDGILPGRSARSDAGRGIPSQPHRAHLLADLGSRARLRVIAGTSCGCGKRAVRLQHEGRLNLLPLITHSVPFNEAPALFARIDAGEPGMLQTVLTFGSHSMSRLRIGLLGCGGIASATRRGDRSVVGSSAAGRVLRPR